MHSELATARIAAEHHHDYGASITSSGLVGGFFLDWPPVDAFGGANYLRLYFS